MSEAPGDRAHPAPGSRVPIDPGRVPRHIAFIMDGNGRWARQRGKIRLFGHENGAVALRRIVRHCRKLGVRETTFFALSAENFARRPPREIGFLMKLLARFLIDERPELTENNIRLAVVGDVSGFPSAVLKELDRTLRLTADLDGMVLRLALNYGSRQEIVAAARKLALAALDGRLDRAAIEALDEKAFACYLADPSMRDPDLVIRTAGELRLSNFLLWQSSYSEWWISDALWPDFDVPMLEEALQAYAARERRYGGIGSDADAEVAAAAPPP